MKLFYKQALGAALLTIMLAGTACGPKTKVKTIAIVNGDTTMNEETVLEGAFSTSDNVAEVKIVTSDDVDSIADEATKERREKRIVKKIEGASGENDLPLKNININVDTKTQVLKLDLESENADALNIIVMDEAGKQVFYDTQKKGDKYKKEIKLNKKGIYFLSIIQNKKILNERIVLE